MGIENSRKTSRSQIQDIKEDPKESWEECGSKIYNLKWKMATKKTRNGYK